MPPVVRPINFADTELNHYAGFYAAILDDIFTEEECRSLLSLAVASESWSPAGLSAESETQTVHSTFRNSERILYINAESADNIYDRLRPLVEAEIGEVAVGGQWEGITGKKGRKQGPTWRLVGVNPRLSFLRYGPGHYFKPHCDGLNELVREDGAVHKSFVTLHLYLNGDPGSKDTDANNANAHSDALVKLSDDDPDAPLVGGATRFWTPDKKKYLDVFPRVGRVLVFQQRMLVHSGEEVIQGVKYTMRGDFMYQETV
ncbi:hypothetical protein BDZ97DRAFT_1822573 [Flammula alnicola]|nr:hypothetical protein BDZ97DRAFT_1822573 [Flammula alnicola]